MQKDFPGGAVESACQCRRQDWISGSGRSPGVENGNLLQYSCLGNAMDRGAWWATWGSKQSWDNWATHTNAKKKSSLVFILNVLKHWNFWKGETFFFVDYPSIWIFLKFLHDYIQFMPFLGRTNLEVILCASQDIISGVTWCHYVPSLVMLTSQWQLLGSSTIKLLSLWKVLLSLDKYAFPYQSFPLMIFV